MANASSFLIFFLLSMTSSMTYTSSTILYEKAQVRENEAIGTVVAEFSSFVVVKEILVFKKNFKLLSQKLYLSSLPDNNEIRWFSLNDRTGTLTLRRKLDREEICNNDRICTVRLQVFAKTNSRIIQLDIEIIDMNEFPPSFQNKLISLNLSEGTAVGKTISLDRYLASDKDSGNNSAISYSLEANGYFDLNQNVDEAGSPHLRLVVKQKLDHETKSSFQLNLFAKDGGFPRLSTHVLVQINIIDENDNEPIFEKQTYEVNLLEDMLPGQVIAQVHAKDTDSDLFGPVTYFISGPMMDEASSPFSIDSSSGDIYLKERLDREKVSQYILFLEAADGGNPPEIGRSRLLVDIDDVNDNAPDITVSYIVLTKGNTVFLPESMPIGSSIAYVSAKDVDLDANSDVIISMKALFLSSGRDNNKYDDAMGVFRLKENGIIELTKPLDAEIQSYYKLILNASDRGMKPQWSTEEMDIVVLDENDNAPQFTKNFYNVSVSEDISVGTIITKINASDLDGNNPSALQMNKAEQLVTSRNGNITYSIAEGYSTFSISPRTGTISLVRPLDREQTAKWKITVSASDAGYPLPKSSTCELEITVVDANDNAPIFTNPARDGTTLQASVLKDTVITRIQAVDFDAGKNGKVKFSLLEINGVKQNDHHNESVFVLDSTTGDLRLNMSNPKLLTSLGHYQLLVQAHDTGFPQMTSKKKFNVVVSDDVALPTQMPANFNKTSGNPTFIIIIVASSAFTLFLCTVVMIVACKSTKKHKRNQHNISKSSRFDSKEKCTNSATSRLYDKPGNGEQTTNSSEYKHLIQRNTKTATTKTGNIYGAGPLLTNQASTTGRRQFELNLQTTISSNLPCPHQNSSGFASDFNLDKPLQKFSNNYENSFDSIKREDNDSGQGESGQDTGNGNTSFEHSCAKLKEFHPLYRDQVISHHMEPDWNLKQQKPASTSQVLKTVPRPYVNALPPTKAHFNDVEDRKKPRNLDAIPENSPVKKFLSPNHLHQAQKIRRYQDAFFVHHHCLKLQPPHPPTESELFSSHFSPIGSCSDSTTTGYATEPELV